MSRWRLLLADDHELFRAGLAGLIDSQPDLQVVGQANDGFEAFTLARELRPALLVMDISMPICNGVEAVRLIRATPELADLRIIMLTIHDDDENLFAAIRAGANGYLLKNTNSEEFLRSVRAVFAGEAILPPKLAARLMDEFARLPSQPAAPAGAGEAGVEQELTWREREVLQFIATGVSDQEIADQLTLSVHTVKTHVRHILAKLHAVNRRAAVSEARQRGLL